MEFLGYRLVKISDVEAKELERAKKTLERHGFRAVRVTADKSKKAAAAKMANAAKVKATDEKIQNGLDLWRMEEDQGKKLTAYKLAKLAGVSQNTAKKYLDKINAL